MPDKTLETYVLAFNGNALKLQENLEQKYHRSHRK